MGPDQTAVTAPKALVPNTDVTLMTFCVKACYFSPFEKVPRIIKISLNRFGWIYFVVGNVLVAGYSACCEIVVVSPLKDVANNSLKLFLHRIAIPFTRSYGV